MLGGKKIHVQRRSIIRGLIIHEIVILRIMTEVMLDSLAGPAAKWWWGAAEDCNMEG